MPELFKEIEKNESVPGKVAKQIQALIVDGTLKSGDRLPSETELQEQLNVGRSAVREAIKLLAAQNILEVRRGKGTYVSSRPGMTDDPFGFAYEPDQKKLVNDLLKVRQYMEPLSAYLAAENATDENIAKLKSDLDAFLDAHKHDGAKLEADIKLHSDIARFSGNIVLAKLIPIIIYGIRQVDPMCIAHFGSKEASNTAVKFHTELVDAIAAHDCEAARKSMEDQLKVHETYVG